MTTCQWCKTELRFHQHPEECPDSCHMLHCSHCGYLIDFYEIAEGESLEELQEKIKAYIKKLEEKNEP